MSTQRILKDSTTTIVSYPRVEQGDFVVGVPTSAEVRIGTPAVAMPGEDSWSSALVESVSATLTVAAAVGDTSLTADGVGLLTWLAGRKYLVTPTDGAPLLVTSARTDSETLSSPSPPLLYLTEPLERALSTTTTIAGYSIRIALTAAQTALVGSGVAVFRAVIEGITYSWSTAFRIVRRLVVIPLTGPELTGAYSVVHSMQPATQTLEEVIDAAWEYRLLPTLLAKGVREEDIVDAEALRPLLALACVVHLAVLSRSADPVWRDAVIADFERLTATTFSRVDWHDAPQDADPPRDPDQTRRRVGLRVTR